MIDFERLEKRIPDLRVEYARAVPWKHVVIDGLFEEHVAYKIAEAFPKLGKLKTQLARLLAARSYDSSIGAANQTIRDAFAILYGPRFTAFVEAVSGIANLSADVQSIGAGLHQGSNGSYLRVHADHNTHPTDPTRFRRVNVMVYLNDTWRQEWNGDLELWDREARSVEKRISPVFNRCAILTVDDSAFHGYGPLRIPPGNQRKALAAYFYAPVAATGQSASAHFTTMPAIRSEKPLVAFSHWARRALLFRLERAMQKDHTSDR